jgi:hypothetical protein
MRSVTGIVAVAALAAVAAGCASDPYYARSSYYNSPSYAYSSSPGYVYYSSPGYYRTTTYGYTYPSQRQTYDGYWDYQRNYRGAYSSSPEFSSM